MTGDIILQKRNGWIGRFISFFTCSNYVYVGIETAVCTVVYVDWRGKHYTDISKWGDDIVVLTPHPALTEGQRKALLQSIKHARIRNYHCADFVRAMYRQGAGIDLLPDNSGDTIQPQDLLQSPFLRQYFAGDMSTYIEFEIQNKSGVMMNVKQTEGGKYDASSQFVSKRF